MQQEKEKRIAESNPEIEVGADGDDSSDEERRKATTLDDDGIALLTAFCLTPSLEYTISPGAPTPVP
uniref:Uncharacterized protein n=1 Tax=Setaria digitata TaxID=48799 RepID=A0A915PPE8_9BILA